MSLTEPEKTVVKGVPITVDTDLPKPPADADRLSYRERYTQLASYLRPILQGSNPASVGVFGGSLDYNRLKWWALLFVTVIIQARAGDRRNWDAIRAWARDLAHALSLQTA